jgi:hypothetical protein
MSPRARPCGGAHGRPYDGIHDAGERPYVVITPDDRVLRFCDSDCLRRRLTMDVHDVEDRIRAEALR